MRLAVTAQLPLTLALESPQCGDCWCLYDSAKGEQCPKYPSWREEYSDDEIAMLRSHELINPLSLPCNPYANSTCDTVPALDDSAVLCATRHTADCSTYELRSFSSLGDATVAGFTFTHLGRCGVCSTLQDLASYMANEDMILPERAAERLHRFPRRPLLLVFHKPLACRQLALSYMHTKLRRYFVEFAGMSVKRT